MEQGLREQRGHTAGAADGSGPWLRLCVCPQGLLHRFLALRLGLICSITVAGSPQDRLGDSGVMYSAETWPGTQLGLGNKPKHSPGAPDTPTALHTHSTVT